MVIDTELFKAIKRKNYLIMKALDDQFWVNQLDIIQHGFDLEHVQQFGNQDFLTSCHAIKMSAVPRSK
jgi:hypothetical protein